MSELKPLTAAATAGTSGLLVGVVLPDTTSSTRWVNFAAHVQGLDACNGWTFWQFESNGALVSIDVLRQRLRADLA